MLDRFSGWAGRNMPTREQMAKSRWVPARALERSLWRFNRRSVPRGVALGLVVGILVPVAQIVFAAILALPMRANVPVAALTTFITNPFTTPLIWAGSYQVGAVLLHFDVAGGIGPIERFMAISDVWALIEWLTAQGKVLGLGLVVVATVSAVLGYLLSGMTWRWLVLRRRRRSLGERASAT
ncbi:DUF2062 domain-containing protein [Parablastomonas sp. CN1-191]|uniref:DUF2062 domain-containing protein n=1 Tax=Parablastomonas sp. CN1-191 TaxID=3400908 RepID=UPI003BF7D2EC